MKKIATQNSIDEQELINEIKSGVKNIPNPKLDSCVTWSISRNNQLFDYVVKGDV